MPAQLHVLAPGDIPVCIDRGGQVTYHGPGQLVVYPLIDLRRSGLGIRDLVTALERSVIDLAAEYGVTAERGVARPVSTFGAESWRASVSVFGGAPAITGCGECEPRSWSPSGGSTRVVTKVCK